LGISKYVTLFLTGGTGYVGLELLYRGRSHISMFAAGGLCFLLLGCLRRRQRQLPLPLQGIIGSGIITAVELGIGLLVNRHYQVWDYRAQPLNLFGQICLPFSLLWIPLSMGAMLLYDSMERWLTP